MVALWLPNAASESLEKKKFVSICLGHLGPEHLVPSTAFPNAASESLENKPPTVALWPRTPGPATAFPNLILLQNKPPMVPLWLPNAASESLEKKKFVSICHLNPEHLVPPQLFPI